MFFGFSRLTPDAIRKRRQLFQPVSAAAAAHHLGKSARNDSSAGVDRLQEAVFLRGMQERFLDAVRPHQASRTAPSQPDSKDVLLQVLQQGLHVALGAEDAHANAHAALQVPDLWQELFETLATSGSRSNPHRRETLFLRVLFQKLRRQVQLASSSPDPLADEEVLVPALPKDLQPHELAEQAHRDGLPDQDQNRIRIFFRTPTRLKT